VNNSTPMILGAGAETFDGMLSRDNQWWFAALDQRFFSVGPERLRTQVVGIHRDGPDVWIQLESLGEQLREFIVCISPGTTVNDVIAAIEMLIRDAVRWSRDV
jgi:hypothetical protein